MKVAAAIAEILKRERVEFLIGYPVNPVIEAAAAADLRPIIVRQERVGLHMADAVSRQSSGRTIGVFALQHGPGAENAFGGIAQAYSESVPILVFAAGYGRRLNNYDPFFNAFLNYQHITKWIEQVTCPDAVPDVLRRAFSQLRNGRPRPVVVEIPVDVFLEEVPEPLNYQPTFHTRSGPDPQAVSDVARVLVDAQRPRVAVPGRVEVAIEHDGACRHGIAAPRASRGRPRSLCAGHRRDRSSTPTARGLASRRRRRARREPRRGDPARRVAGRARNAGRGGDRRPRNPRT